MDKTELVITYALFGSMIVLMWIFIIFIIANWANLPAIIAGC